jgi:hypothetical protein
VVDPATVVRRFMEGDPLPLSWLLEGACPGCGGGTFTTCGHWFVWELDGGEPAAVVCSERCKATVAAALAQSHRC